MHYTRIAVTGPAKVISAPDFDGGRLWVRNDGAVDVFIGGSDVAADGSIGYRLPAAAQIGPIETQPGEGQLWAIAASGTCNVYVLQTGEHV